MKNDPKLAGPKLYHEHDKTFNLIVRGGLHSIKGNHAPYFSLTGDINGKKRNGQWYEAGGGCCHDIILKLFPEFADLVALHLSDIDGVPMYAEANGWYNLAGALGGMGERYHVGNSKHNFPIEPPPDKPWVDTEYRLPTQEECLGFFADHCRVTIEQAREIIAGIFQTDDPGVLIEPALRGKCIRAGWAKVCDAMKPRWKVEAEACIAKHDLKVYGDPWERAA